MKSAQLLFDLHHVKGSHLCQILTKFIHVLLQPLNHIVSLHHLIALLCRLEEHLHREPDFVALFFKRDCDRKIRKFPRESDCAVLRRSSNGRHRRPSFGSRLSPGAGPTVGAVASFFSSLLPGLRLVAGPGRSADIRARRLCLDNAGHGRSLHLVSRNITPPVQLAV